MCLYTFHAYSTLCKRGFRRGKFRLALLNIFFSSSNHLWNLTSSSCPIDSVCVWRGGPVIGRNCHNYHFCCDNFFVMTNMYLSQQTRVCHDNMSFVATNVCLSQQNFVVTNISVATNLLSWQTILLQQIFIMTKYFCCDKYLSKHLPRQTCLFCHDKNILLRLIFVAASILLSRQKLYLWQLPSIIGFLLGPP